MKKILIINGHQPFPTSAGKLTRSYVVRVQAFCKARGYEVRTIESATEYDLNTEVENQLWADTILLQFPLNSMGLPWSLKRYLDEVYTAGMDGRLAKGDGRSRSDPSRQYGSGGRLRSTRYMLSVTLNAPESAFSDPEQTLFAGRSLDDLLTSVHINFAFFGMRSLPGFAAFDVNKNPAHEADFLRFDRHLEQHLA